MMLTPARQSELETHKLAIRDQMRRNVTNIADIGRRLIECKRILGHGNWGRWLATEFEWTQQTAERFMSVAKTMADNPQIVEFRPSAIYALQSAGQPAVERAIKLHEAGERITYERATQIAREEVTDATLASETVRTIPMDRPTSISLRFDHAADCARVAELLAEIGEASRPRGVTFTRHRARKLIGRLE